jgi:deoxycytidylate deaminase
VSILSRRESKLKCFARFTKDLASLSQCKRAQVGCVIIDYDLTQVLSIGFNGQPAGVPHDSCDKVVGGCGCVHAEANALVKLNSTLTDNILICTMSPCRLCAGMIINSKRINTVLYLERYRDTEPLRLLEITGINHDHI